MRPSTEDKNILYNYSSRDNLAGIITWQIEPISIFFNLADSPSTIIMFT